MSGSIWRLHARQVIDQAMTEAKDQGLDATAALKLIDSRYPFGPREYHPYSCWLIERKIARQRLGVAVQTRSWACRFCKDTGCLVCGMTRADPIEVSR